MKVEQLTAALEQLTDEAVTAVRDATSSKVLNDVRIEFTGRNGKLNEFTQAMRDLANEDKPKLGQAISTFNRAFDEAHAEKSSELAELELQEELEQETIDVTLPGKTPEFGVRHILTQTREELEDLFLNMGYQVVDGPEVEFDSYNFEKMNLPKGHPARDMQDTFYIDDEVLLRTHTSPVQARVMEEHDFSTGALKMVSPGKVFRRDNDDATHSHQFSQIEGLVVAENISLADLKGTLLQFAQATFGPEQEIRLRPSFFSFTEPSVEVDVSCFKCDGAGCSVCKQTGWIEILGSGVVHPYVLEMSGIDSDKYSGFAFGMGIERIAMLKHNIDDIRHFYQNDVRFLEQFQGGQR